MVLSFYEALAHHYHLLFEDWNKAIERQARILAPLLAAEVPGRPLKILDCACGIGTQAIGFASFGHQVVASDLSGAAVTRAKHEAEARGLTISCLVSDMTSLGEIVDRDFDVVAAMDNALPHLTVDPVNPVDQLRLAVAAVRSRLKPNGLFMASIRDYDALILERPSIQKPNFFGQDPERRIVHQVWDWREDARYIVHLYITMQSNQSWTNLHFVSEYRCLLREDLTTVLASAGYGSVRWLMPSESGYYQPIVLARRLE